MRRFLAWFPAWISARRSAAGRAPDARHALGLRGEARAAEHYRAQGYEVLEQRWRSRFGEVDLLLERRARGARREVIAVEVKTRSARRRDGLDDPVAETRAEQLERVERALRTHPRARPSRRTDPARGPLLRVDLVAVLVRADGELELAVSQGRPFEGSRARSGRHQGFEAEPDNRR